MFDLLSLNVLIYIDLDFFSFSTYNLVDFEIPKSYLH